MSMVECTSAKTLLIISGGIEAVPGILAAKKMGLFVVVCDIDPDAPGFLHADDRIISSTYDVSGTVEKARQYHASVRKLDGVICIAADVPLTVAAVAEALELPGIGSASATLASDKLKMKRHLAKHGVAVPWFSEVESFEHLSGIIRERGYPLIIKPLDSRGSRGVLKLNEQHDLSRAYKYCRSQSKLPVIIAEEFLEGPQISTESVILDGRGYTVGFSDRNYEYIERYAPYIIENGGQQPSILNPGEKRQVSRLAEQAAVAMGIENGIAKGDMVLTREGPKVIEIAARLSGGWFSTDQIPLSTGVDIIGAAIRLALGEKVDPVNLSPKFNKGVAIRYFFPRPGKITAIRNLESFAHISWIHKIMIFYKEGEVLEQPSNHTKRAGFVITVGDTREQAVARAKEVINTIEIATQL